MDTNKVIESYLNYTKTVWIKVKEKFNGEPLEAQVIAFERATAPLKYWLENEPMPDKKEQAITDHTLTEIAQKYNLIIEEDKLKIPKGGLDTGDFIAVSSELKNLGYKYQKGKGYFAVEAY